MEEEENKAWNKSLRYLGYRQRTEKELQLYLKNKEFTDRVVKKVIQKLRESGFVDDRRFAIDWIRYSFSKGKGSVRVLKELKVKGISESVIDDLKEKEFSDIAECELAKKTVEKYLPVNYEKDDRKLLKRTANYLIRRGFTGEIVYKTIGEYFFDENIF